MSETRARFVLICQQALACAVVVAVTAPAAGVASLDIVAPRPEGGVATRPGTSTEADAAGPARPGPEASLVSTEAVEPEVTEVPLTTEGEALVEDNAEEVAPEVADAPNALVAARSEPRELDGYATVGVTWSAEEDLTEDDITLSARTLRDGSWSEWGELHHDAEHGPDPGDPEADGRAESRDLTGTAAAGDPAAPVLRDGTDAVVVGEADDVQVRAVARDGDLPADMDLVVVDPGVDTATAYQAPDLGGADAPTGPAAGGPDALKQESAPAGGLSLAASTTADKPRIYSRKQWGANERMRDGSPSYGSVEAGFVHHTVNANSYTRDQVPAIIRGIYAYHTQSRGWSDVGYNFLVDRFGRIWEGRYGGVSRAVIGAHTLGYNHAAFAASAIGNFDTARPPKAILTAYARLFAWKLGIHGVDAGSMRRSVAGRTMPALSGHRDVGQTACPGRYLYAKIGAIRSRADALQSSGPPPEPEPAVRAGHRKDTNVLGRRWPDLVVRNRATQELVVVRTGGQVGFKAGRVVRTGWGRMDKVEPVRDVTGDGRPDLLARVRATKLTSIHPGNRRGGFGPPVGTTKAFAGLDQIAGVGDLTGDGRADVAGRADGSHALRLYPGRGRGRFADPRRLRKDWDHSGLAGVADMTGDGRPDLVGRSAGSLWLWPGARDGELGEKRRVAGDWGAYPLVTGLGDLTNDGRPDLLARGRKGVGWVFPGKGGGRVGHPYGGFQKLRGLDMVATGGEVAGSAHHDIVARDEKGRLRVYTNRGRRAVTGSVGTGTILRDTDLLLNAGDWDGDGRNDVLTRRASDGAMLLRRGRTGARFARPLVIGRGWDRVSRVAAVGDTTGDGRPDLMGQPRGSGLVLYPGDGSSGFKRSREARGPLDARTHEGVSFWNADRYPDTIVRRGDGTLAMFPGDGTGGLGRSKEFGRTSRYDWLVGAGDVDADGEADLLGRAKADGRLWLLPGERIGLGPRRYVGAAFGRFDLVG